MGLFPTNNPAYDAIYAEEEAALDAAEAIAIALDGAGIRRAELAAILGISRSEITARLRGERNITVRKLAATVHALGYRINISVEPIETAPEKAVEASPRQWQRNQGERHEPAREFVTQRQLIGTR